MNKKVNEEAVEKPVDRKKIAIGGQALIEGILMKGKDNYSIGLLKSDNSVKIISNKYKSFASKGKFFRLPFIRGVVNLLETMIIGIKALLLSADEAIPEEEKKEEETEQKASQEKENGFSNLTIFLALLTSFAFAIGAFGLLPDFIVSFLGLDGQRNPMVFNLVTGIIRISFFIIYVYVISLFEDVKRVFQFHGAEHKTINAFEAKEDLTVENVKKYPTFHPRCGTSFMAFVLMIAIIVFSFVNLLLNYIPAVKSLQTNVPAKIEVSTFADIYNQSSVEDKSILKKVYNAYGFENDLYKSKTEKGYTKTYTLSSNTNINKEKIETIFYQAGHNTFINKILLTIIRVFSHMLFLPLVAGISYEAIKLTFKTKENFLTKILMLPGKMIQKITTREPDENQINTAIQAVRDALKDVVTV